MGANPSPDLYGNAGVWSYMQSANNNRTPPSAYSPLTTFDNNPVGYFGLSRYLGTEDATLGVNKTAAPVAMVPAGVFYMHTATNSQTVLRWTSPVPRSCWW